MGAAPWGQRQDSQRGEKASETDGRLSHDSKEECGLRPPGRERQTDRKQGRRSRQTQETGVGAGPCLACPHCPPSARTREPSVWRVTRSQGDKG